MDLCFGRSSETKSRFKARINPSFVVRNPSIPKAPDVACHQKSAWHPDFTFCNISFFMSNPNSEGTMRQGV